MTFDRSDPDWTFDDSWQVEEPEPVTLVPCPCCGGFGHFAPASSGGGGFYCTGRIDRINRELRSYTQGGPLPADVDVEVSCERCGDAGVIPHEPWEPGGQASTTAELLSRLSKRGGKR